MASPGEVPCHTPLSGSPNQCTSLVRGKAIPEMRMAEVMLCLMSQVSRGCGSTWKTEMRLLVLQPPKHLPHLAVQLSLPIATGLWAPTFPTVLGPSRLRVTSDSSSSCLRNLAPHRSSFQPQLNCYVGNREN